MSARPPPFDLSTKGINAKSQEPQAFELDALTRTRLMLAGQIAAGLVSNPAHVACRDWENQAVRIATDMAAKLIRLNVSGGF